MDRLERFQELHAMPLVEVDWLVVNRMFTVHPNDRETHFIVGNDIMLIVADHPPDITSGKQHAMYKQSTMYKQGLPRRWFHQSLPRFTSSLDKAQFILARVRKDGHRDKFHGALRWIQEQMRIPYEEMLLRISAWQITVAFLIMDT